MMKESASEVVSPGAAAAQVAATKGSQRRENIV